jgi:hypothetical protein
MGYASATRYKKEDKFLSGVSKLITTNPRYVGDSGLPVGHVALATSSPESEPCREVVLQKWSVAIHASKATDQIGKPAVMATLVDVPLRVTVLEQLPGLLQCEPGFCSPSADGAERERASVRVCRTVPDVRLVVTQSFPGGDCLLGARRH